MSNSKTTKAAEKFQFPIKHASRDLKAILGEGFQFPKWKSDLNPKAVNVLTLEQFNQLAFELALKGNVQAIEFMRDLSGLSLHQLFSDAFGQKFEAEDRQSWQERVSAIWGVLLVGLISVPQSK